MHTARVSRFIVGHEIIILKAPQKDELEWDPRLKSLPAGEVILNKLTPTPEAPRRKAGTTLDDRRFLKPKYPKP